MILFNDLIDLFRDPFNIQIEIFRDHFNNLIEIFRDNFDMSRIIMISEHSLPSFPMFFVLFGLFEGKMLRDKKNKVRKVTFQNTEMSAGHRV